MENKTPKSATTAGLLGIFFGSVGAHNWYLGEKKFGIIHVSLFGGVILLELLASAILPAIFLSSLRGMATALWLTPLVAGLGGIVALGNGIWGLVDAIIILSKGDAGLAERLRKHGAVAATAAPATAPAASSSDGTTPESGADTASSSTAAPASTQPVSPKQPMDPAKKKKLIMIIAIAGSAVVLGIAAAIIIPILLRVDYSESYLTAKELRSEISDMYSSSACDYVVRYVSSTSYDMKKYNEYINQCAEFGSEASELVAKLESTAGVKRNKDIKEQFESFKRLFDATAASGEDKESILNLYKTWHEWALAADKLGSWNQTDADLTAAANILINSGEAKFRTYAEGWLERRKAAAEAYRAYDSASYSDPQKSALRNALNDAKTAYNNWIPENKPSTSEFGDLTTGDVSKMKSEFDKLYKIIRTTYEKNYNKGSKDCWELVGEVTCD